MNAPVCVAVTVHSWTTRGPSSVDDVISTRRSGNAAM